MSAELEGFFDAVRKAFAADATAADRDKGAKAARIVADVLSAKPGEEIRPDAAAAGAAASSTAPAASSAASSAAPPAGVDALGMLIGKLSSYLDEKQRAKLQAKAQSAAVDIPFVPVPSR